MNYLLQITEKFKIVLTKEIDAKERVPGNTLKHLLGNRSMQVPFIAVYDFGAMIVESDDQSKPEEWR